MVKILGVIMILGGATSLGLFEKNKLSMRVKSLKQMILAVEIMKRELKFYHIEIPKLMELLSIKIKHPLATVFKQIDKLIKKDDYLSVEHKWTKTFKEYGSFVGLLKEDIDIIINIATVLGKFDVDEQVSSLDYFKTLLDTNLKEATNKNRADGNIYRTVAITVGLVLVIILI